MSLSPILLAALLPAVLAACAHTDVSLNARMSGGLAAAIVAGVVIAGTARDLNNPPPPPRYESFSDWFWGRPAPTMDPDRAVSDQDCTKPIATSGNLRCR